VQPGEDVLINGAGGGAGSFAVQLAKLDGASVTGVDNPEKLDFLRSVGADHVIDYTREDFTRSGKQYDLILDVIATRSAFAYPRVPPNGRYFCVADPCNDASGADPEGGSDGHQARTSASS
jgi:NADPH:quinone reductase-like Zn-dependent oxidoreductase